MHVELNIRLPLSNCTTAVSPSTYMKRNGPSHVWKVFQYTSTGDPDGRFQSFSDNSLSFGPLWCLRSNATSRLDCSFSTILFTSSIAFFLVGLCMGSCGLGGKMLQIQATWDTPLPVALLPWWYKRPCGGIRRRLSCLFRGYSYFFVYAPEWGVITLYYDDGSWSFYWFVFESDSFRSE